jgi:type II secretory ATPase GspE/PulE/Tfp pilus assembly ATPase PilB-like protein
MTSTNSQAPNVSSVNDLPEGQLLSGKGGIYSVPENQREQIAVWHPRGSALWVLCTDIAQKTTTYIQVRKRISEKNGVVAHAIIVKDGVLKSLYERSDREIEEQKASGSLQDSHVIQKFNTIMSTVVGERASDIHIEKRQDSANIKIRKNGEIIPLEGFESVSPLEATQLCTVIYNVLAEADSKDVSYNEALIQQGAVKMSVEVGKEVQEIKLRYQSVPVYPNGFDVIMRVLPVGKDDTYTSLEELGYEQSQIKLILECISKAVGAMVIAGVTGSGKSTTLKNLLMWENESREFSEKIFTVEDPPEYAIPKVSQIPVARRKDDAKEGRRPFEDAIKACMRGDPDIIMVGEIRDMSTGDLLKKAVQSGHRVRTTVHASSALGVIDRLLDFGISSSTLASQEFIAGLMYQRLLAKLCQNCSVSLSDAVASSSAPKAVLEISKRIERLLEKGQEDVGKYMGRVRLRGPGCKEKNCQRGVTGRTVCAEVVKPDLKVLKAFKENDIMGALEHLRNVVSDGSLISKNMVGKSAMAHAVMKMFQGEVDPVELERSFGILSMDEIRGLPEVHSEDYKEDEFKF